MNREARFLRFLLSAQRIIAEHKMQYHGVYFMDTGGGESQRMKAAKAQAAATADQAAGNTAQYQSDEASAQYHAGKVGKSSGGILGAVEDFAAPIVDVGAELLTGGAATPFLPLINAGVDTSVDLARGDSIGKSLGQGAIGGAETLGLQEAGGALGIGQGNSAFNNALGITGDTPAGTGLPDIGSAISGAATAGGNAVESALGIGSSATANAPGIASAVPSASGLPASTPIAGASGGALGGVANSIAPSGIGAGGGDITLGNVDLPSGLNGSFGGGTGTSIDSAATGAPGSPATAGGGANAGTQGLPNGATGINVATPSYDANGNLLGGGTSGGAGGATAGGGGIINSIESALGKNPVGALATGGALLGDLAKSQNVIKGQRQIQAEAGQLAGQGSQLEGYLQSGTLPPGLQTSINQATEAAKAQIRSSYAAKGMSGSSAEQQDLAQVDARAQASGAQQAMQLLQTGISETGMASKLYQQLLGDTLTEDSQLGSAFGAFSSALGGGTGKTTTTTTNS